MHDVLDPRDLVPDEAEQLKHSGYPVGSLLEEAQAVAATGDQAALRAVRQQLARLDRAPDWLYEEPEDDAALMDLALSASPLPVDPDALPSKIHGAWLGRAVGNTLGKPVEGLSRRQVQTYLRAAGQWPQTGYLPLLDPLPDGVPALHPSAPTATAGRFVDVPRDDDLDWTILALH
ncbi:MAG: ADP-ribosylglycohydrolase family protein, partial [Gemmatimonadota bacterium]|nr:ADP-ribosylglycohydrolase family protein [Gemmatimonadota bacterium]